MEVFRMAIPASVCVDIPAESEEVAKKLAKAWGDELCDGIDLDVDGAASPRLYLFPTSDDDEASVEDVSELQSENGLPSPGVHCSWVLMQLWVNSYGLRCRVDPEGWEKMDFSTRRRFIEDCKGLRDAED